MVDLAREGHNVIVSRTFSKIYGMAGMRVGYMISTPQNLERVDQYKACWVAAPSVAAAIAAFGDDAFLAQSKSKVIEAREMVMSAVKAVGLSFLPSQTNFLYVDVISEANSFQTKMRDRKILIRGVYRDYLRWSRVSMGHLRDVERYVKALPEVLAS
jgi:histidinol-phosphate aminotransferase